MHPSSIGCLLLGLLAACTNESQAVAPVAVTSTASSPVESKPEASANSKGATEDPSPASGADVAPSDAPDAVDPAAMEKDPNATPSVVAVDAEGKLPEDAEASGAFVEALVWTDRYGKHAVVFGLTTREAGDAVTSLLVADFMSWEGDAWVSQRKFKERVAACEFDTTLEPFVGDWSITDLDENGIAEVTFAWRAGCRSDVSPLDHKVLLVGFDAQAQVAKYVLRGTSGIEIGGSLDPGSRFRADPAFSSAPPAFLAHAESVWSKTAVESF